MNNLNPNGHDSNEDEKRNSYNQLIHFSDNFIGLILINSLKIFNENGKEIKRIDFDFDITRNHCNESCFYFSVTNSIFKHDIKCLSYEPVQLISFHEKVNVFSFNKSAFIVSLQNKD